MKKTNRYVALLICISLLLVALTACSEVPATTSEAVSSTEAQSSTAATDEGQVEIVYWQQVRSDTSLSDFQALAEEFNKLHPNVTVDVEEISPNDVGTKVETAIMAGTQPDVLMDSMMRIGKYANNGLLVDLSDMYPDFKDVFVSSNVDMATMDGKIYGVPATYSPYGVLVNLDMFKAAGAENLLPQNEDRSWTREQYEAALKAITKDGVTGTAFFAGSESSDVDTKTLIEGGTGFSLFADDYSKVLYDEPRGIEGVEWLQSLIDEGLAVKGAESMVDDDAWELFAQQKIGVLAANLWCASWIQGRVDKGELAPFNIQFVQYPNIDGQTPKTPVNGVVFSVFDKGDQLKVKYAKEWIDFVSNSDAEKACNIAQNALSARLDRQDLYADNEEMNWVATVLSQYGYNPGYVAKIYQDTRMLLFPELQAVFSGQKTAEEAMKEFAQEANALITQ